MSTPNDDAQRTLEQRALRNVRGLLDKMEDEERVDRRQTVKIAVVCGVVALVFFVIVIAWLGKRGEPGATTVVVTPPAKTAK